MNTNRDYITQMAVEGGYDVTFYDGLDDAIVGLVSRFGFPCPVVAYDYEKVIKILMRDNGLDRDQAEEHYAFNIIGGWIGDTTPVFLTSLP